MEGNTPWGDVVVSFVAEDEEFKTTVNTLRAHPHSLLAGLCQECPQSIGWGGPIQINRTAEAFEWILSLYRPYPKGRSVPEGWSMRRIQEELDFFQMPSMRELDVLVTGNTLLCTEADIAVSVAEDILVHLSRLDDQLLWFHHVEFLVWFHEVDRTAFFVKVLDRSETLHLHSLRKMIMKQLKELSGSKEWAFQPTDGPPGLDCVLENGYVFPKLPKVISKHMQKHLKENGYKVSFATTAIPLSESISHDHTNSTICFPYFKVFLDRERHV